MLLARKGCLLSTCDHFHEQDEGVTHAATFNFEQAGGRTVMCAGAASMWRTQLCQMNPTAKVPSDHLSLHQAPQATCSVLFSPVIPKELETTGGLQAAAGRSSAELSDNSSINRSPATLRLAAPGTPGNSFRSLETRLTQGIQYDSRHTRQLVPFALHSTYPGYRRRQPAPQASRSVVAIKQGSLVCKQL